MEANTKMRDMTQGSPAKHIFLFSLPLLLGAGFLLLAGITFTLLHGNRVLSL